MGDLVYVHSSRCIHAVAELWPQIWWRIRVAARRRSSGNVEDAEKQFQVSHAYSESFFHSFNLVIQIWNVTRTCALVRRLCQTHASRRRSFEDAYGRAGAHLSKVRKGCRGEGSVLLSCALHGVVCTCLHSPVYRATKMGLTQRLPP